VGTSVDESASETKISSFTGGFVDFASFVLEIKTTAEFGVRDKRRPSRVSGRQPASDEDAKTGDEVSARDFMRASQKVSR